MVFDLDDTLYPERAFVQSGFRAVAAWAQDALSLPAEQTTHELWRLFEQGVRGDTFNRWLADRGLDDHALVPVMVQVYRGHRPEIAPYAGAAELLERLGRRYRLGLLTDGDPAVQRGKLAALGLGRCFQAVVCSGELGRDAWKPSPRPFELVLRRLGVAGPRAVYVADNPEKDFLGARRIGMGTVRLRHRDGLYRHLQPASPEHAPHMDLDGFQQLEEVFL